MWNIKTIVISKNNCCLLFFLRMIKSYNLINIQKHNQKIKYVILRINGNIHMMSFKKKKTND